MTGKPILFCDFDGTICFDRYWRSLPKELHERVQNLLFGEDRTLVRAWMLGQHTAEDINRAVAEKLAVPYAELWELFVRDCKTMRVSPATLKRLSELRKKFVVILVTVNMDSFSRFTVPALELERYFDRISNSYNERAHKADGGVFRRYLEEYAAPISQSIVIDNSAAVCEAFRQLGGRSCLVTREHAVDEYLSTL